MLKQQPYLHICSSGFPKQQTLVEKLKWVSHMLDDTSPITKSMFSKALKETPMPTTRYHRLLFHQIILV